MKSRTLIPLLCGRVLFALALLMGGPVYQISAADDLEQRLPKLKWVFDKDPRALGLKIADGHGVVKFRLLKDFNIVYGRNASLIDIIFKVRKESSEGCAFDQGEILWLRIPDDYFRGPHDKVGSIRYDIGNLSDVRTNSDYYGIVDCTNVNQILYIR